MALLSVRELGHTFPDGTAAIRDINLDIEQDDFMVLAGKNGSGKTVLMLHLNGLLSPTHGSVAYRGEPIGRNISLVRQKIGLVFQDPDSQLIGQTVSEDVAFGPENLGLGSTEIHKRVDESLTMLGIEHLRDQRPFTLSGGEKRKAALAGVIAMRPEIIILDEPFAGLDLPGVRNVLESLTLLHSAGHTMIVISHDIEKVLAHSSRLVLMSDGRIVADGLPEETVHKAEENGVRGPSTGMTVEKMT